MPRIIHIASTHRPTDGRIFRKECRTLADAGYDVTLIIPHDGSETVDGIRIEAVPRPSSGWERLTRTLGLLYEKALAGPEDAIYHFHDAELVFHMLRLARTGRRVVYDVHEDTPLQVRYQTWIPAVLRPLVARLMRRAEARADRTLTGIITAEPATMRRFSNPRSEVVRNFPRLEDYEELSPRSWNERPNHILYMGGLSTVRGVAEMMQAVDAVPAVLDARLRLAGSFHPASLERDIRSWAGYDRTTTLGWLGQEGLMEELSRARVGIVTLHPTEKYLSAYPTKLFEYMAAGLPVVASDFPSWREFVLGPECGILVDPLDAGAIAEAVTYLLEHPDEAARMGSRGLEAVRAGYNWESESRKLLRFYEGLLRG